MITLQDNKKIIFSEYVKKYNEIILNVKKYMYELQKTFDQGIIINKNNEFSNLINNKLSYKYNQINNDIKKIEKWLESYIKNMELLGTGFINNQNMYLDNNSFKEAKIILESEL